MRQASSNLIALLNADQFLMADLYTITTIQGDVYRYTSYDFDLMIAGDLYQSDGPIIEREGITQNLGIEIDNLSITILVNDDTLFSDVPIVQAFHNGILDGARFRLQRVFMDIQTPTDTSAGAITLFEGSLIEPEMDRNQIHVNVASDTSILNVKMPRNLYQPSCLNTLFDSGCGLLRDNFMVTTQIELNSTPSRIICTLHQPQGWFTQGVNRGLKRTVRLHESGALLLTLPLLKMPTIGEVIKVYPGCDKRLITCDNRFNNRARFRGAPFVPVPETAI